jgi:prepilin-type N-terminal cleavage/methylation domain-containing protein
MKKLNKGFTLIELLVVIAIIGILSSVVLASLNSARSKGNDTAVKSNLLNARTQAELFYDGTTGYEGVCAISGTNTVGNQVKAAASANGATYTYSSPSNDAANGTTAIAVCHDSTAGWAAIAPLKTGGAFCVDYNGFGATTTIDRLDTDADVTCTTP